MNILTQKSKFVLKKLYEIHLDRLNDSPTDVKPNYFGSLEVIHDMYFQNMSEDDLQSVFRALYKYNFINAVPHGNSFICISLPEEPPLISKKIDD